MIHLTVDLEMQLHGPRTLDMSGGSGRPGPFRLCCTMGCSWTARLVALGLGLMALAAGPSESVAA